MNSESSTDAYVLPRVKQRASGKLLCNREGVQSALNLGGVLGSGPRGEDLGGGMEEGCGERGSRGREYMQTYS